MTGPRDDKTTHFGFREVPESAKAGLVGQVFSSVASRYDVMNDVMSFGIHRLWKRFTIGQAGVRTGQKVLDLAGGTGDLAAQFVTQVGAAGSVTVADINAAMLDVGRARFADRGLAGNVEFVQANAECLPFPDNHFDCITIAFGLRNVTHIDAALASMFRVLKPGGRLLVLEFSKPVLPGPTPCTTPIPFICCRSSASSSPTTKTVTATWSSRSASTRPGDAQSHDGEGRLRARALL